LRRPTGKKVVDDADTDAEEEDEEEEEEVEEAVEDADTVLAAAASVQRRKW
jgi:hypothetical protein